MSVQLILFPQNYNGTYSSWTGIPNQFIVDGKTFSGVNSASSISTTNVYHAIPPQLVAAYPATIPNTWYKYRYAVDPIGYPNLPYNTSVSVVFDIENNSNSRSGIYQKVTNLTPGTSYTVSVEVAAFTGGLLRFNEIWTGSWDASSYAYASTFTGSTYSWTFQAKQAEETIMIETRGSAGGSGSIILTEAILIPAGQSPSEVINILGNGQVICDLYEDEEVPLSLSVDEFKNVAEQLKSHSKPFMLPGTKRNNEIFENLFDVTRSSLGVQSVITFNPYAKTQCILKQDGLVIFEGFLRVLDIQDKEGEISYNVNVYDQVITLADSLADKTFNDIDLSELEHTYDKDSIKDSWSNSTGLPLTNFLSIYSYAYEQALGTTRTNVLKYPFVDWTHQILVADGVGTAATVGKPELTSLQQAFRPFIQVKYLINRIFEPLQFTYTSSFFDTADFEKLFMDFNWGGTESPMVFDTVRQGIFHQSTYPVTLNSGTTGNLEFMFGFSGLADITPDFGWDSGNKEFKAVTDNQIYNVNCFIEFGFLSGFATIKLEWVRTGTIGAEEVIYPQIFTGSSGFQSYSVNFTTTLQKDETLKCRYTVTSNNVTVPQSGGGTPLTVGTSASTTAGNDLLQTLRADMGQWEFLKGIITMFNLVTIPDDSDPNNIIIEPYSDLFIDSLNINSGSTNDLTLKSRGVIYDWTEKVDVTEIKLKPLSDLSKESFFKFEEDEEDYSFNNYKKNTQQHLYGSQKFDGSTFLTGSLESILQGKEEIVASPFAATIIKQYDSFFPDLIVPAIYAYNPDDRTSNPFDNLPRIMYNNGVKTLPNTGTYYIPAQNGKGSENVTQGYLQFSHLTDIPTSKAVPETRDFHFGICQLFPGIGSPTTLNLFNTYWLPYLKELYNPDTRIMEIKVNLNASDINKFKFYNSVFIKNREFRVNKIDYKPNDLSTVEFILIP